jgi:hypothetical protein
VLCLLRPLLRENFNEMAIASNRPRLFVLSDPRGLADWRAFSQSESAPLDVGGWRANGGIGCPSNRTTSAGS